MDNSVERNKRIENTGPSLADSFKSLVTNVNRIKNAYKSLQKEVACLKEDKRRLQNVYAEQYERACRLQVENWQLKGALGYHVPGDIPDDPNILNGIADALSRQNEALQVERDEWKAEAYKLVHVELERDKAIESLKSLAYDLENNLLTYDEVKQDCLRYLSELGVPHDPLD